MIIEVDESGTQENLGLLIKRVLENESTKTMLLFVDGFSKCIGNFIDCLFNVFGLEINYIGGGAGSLSLEQKPCLFTNEGVFQDSAVLAMFDVKSGIGVRHGWKSVEGPYKVTQSDKNSIKTLDWRPAFEVYRHVVQQHSGRSFEKENFFELAKAYPFGITKIGTERIVRDPVMLGAEDVLICVGEMTEGSFVDILHGSKTSLIEASGEAFSACKQAFGEDAKGGSGYFHRLHFPGAFSRGFFQQGAPCGL